MSQKRPTKRERRAAARSLRRAGPTTDARQLNGKAADAAICAALALLVIAVFLPARGYQFISLDDPQYVSANPIVLKGLTSEGFRWAFAFGSSFYWHPLTWLSHMLDIEVFGPNPGPHHMVNVVLHVASTLLLFLALRRMTGFGLRSAFVAALFAIHPLHVESVAWIAERKDVLSTVFLMAALYAYARYVEQPTLSRRLIVAAAFALGLLAKPMIATFPFLLLVLDYWPLDRVGKGWIRLMLEKTELFVLAVGSVIATLISQRGSSGVVALEAVSLPARIANALVSYCLYIRDMFWPARLAAFYPLSIPSPVATTLSAMLLIAITLVAIRFRRSFPFLIVGWLWFLGALVPVIGLVQAGDQGRADRFTYFPLVGLFIALTWLIAAGAQRVKIDTPLRSIAAIVVVAVLSVVTRHQLSYWQDDLSLWERASAVTSDNYRAEEHLGVALTDRGRTEDGIAHYEAALRIWPDYPEAHNNLGAARMDQRNYALAINEFAAAVKAEPRNPGYRYNLAVALDAQGRRKEAIDQVRSGLEVNPHHADLRRAAEVFGLK